ncbi:MAG: M50 family metallopeptidase [Bryobacteraceae bacterium]
MKPGWARAGRAYLGVAGWGLMLAPISVALTLLSANVPGRRTVLVLFVSLLVALAGAVMAIAWRKLHSGAPGARNWAIAAFLLHLPLIGVPTLIGIAGLIVFWKPENVAAAAVKKGPTARQIAGDGTRPWFEQVMGYGSLVVLYGCSWLWGRWADAHQMSSPGWLATIVQLVIAFLLTIALHECGHLLAGWKAGMKLAHFAVGPFVWKMRGGRMVFAFEPAAAFQGAAGMVLLDFREPLRRHAIMTIGGPTASILVAAMATVAALSCPGTAFAGAWWFFAALASLSFVGGPLNLIPAKIGPMYTDGALLYQFLTDGPMARVHLAMSMVSSSIATPLRPRDWDLETLARAVEVMDHGMQGMLLRMYTCMHHLDSDRLADALEQYVATVPLYADALPEGKHDADLAAEMLFVGALLYRNPAAARIWWGRVESSGASRQELDYWRARAALGWLECERDVAAASLAKAEEFARKLPQAGAYDFDRDSLIRLRVAIEESGERAAASFQ